MVTQSEHLPKLFGQDYVYMKPYIFATYMRHHLMPSYTLIHSHTNVHTSI